MSGSGSRRSVLNVEDAARVLGISRNSAYEAVARGEIPSLRFGKRIVIPKVALERLLAGDGEADLKTGAKILEGPADILNEQANR